MKTPRLQPSVVALLVSLSLSLLACESEVTVETGGAGGGGNGGAGGAGGATTASTGTAGATAGTTSVTTASVTTSSTTTGNPLVLGLPCASDADCGQGGQCLTVQGNSAVLGGGPAGGYCSKDCETDSDCPGIDGWCLIGSSGGGECFLGCIHGEPELQTVSDPLDPGKCHGREDLRCQFVEGSGGEVCLPTCGSDAHCSGRFCDPRLEVCVDVPNEGKPLGEGCDPDGAGTECAGVCIPIATGDGVVVGLCSSPCAMGGDVYDAFECGGPGYGICLYSPAGSGVGDLGYCTEVCGEQDHCAAPDFFCFNVGLPEYGVCIISNPCLSDADCEFPGSACVDTPLGQYCMSPEYPLGNL